MNPLYNSGFKLNLQFLKKENSRPCTPHYYVMIRNLMKIGLTSNFFFIPFKINLNALTFDLITGQS